MIYGAYAVLDSKANAFGVPFFMASRGLAVRAFTTLATDPKSTVSKYPEDFHLYQVGAFNDETAELVPCVPQSMGPASMFSNGAPAREMDVTAE